jgi:hypothetical protein
MKLGYYARRACWDKLLNQERQAISELFAASNLEHRDFFR